jgi:hypothetical protein
MARIMEGKGGGRKAHGMTARGDSGQHWVVVPFSSSHGRGWPVATRADWADKKGVAA